MGQALGCRLWVVGWGCACPPNGICCCLAPFFLCWHRFCHHRRLLADSYLPLHSHFFLRCGLALALNKLSQYLDSSQVKPLFQFFVPDALNDRNPDVRKCMLDAALATLNAHGKVRGFQPAEEMGLSIGHGDSECQKSCKALASDGRLPLYLL